MGVFLRNKVMLAIVLTILTAAGKGQSNYFTHYQVESGLSNNAVICSVQDPQGFMWFGTKDGLNRFDGYSFKTFRHADEDTASLGSNFISSLHVDNHGTLWVGCDRGLFRYDAATESFRSVPGAPAAEIMDIQMDPEGVLWFTSGLKLYRFHPATGVQIHRQSVPFPATSLCRTPEGTLWVATASGLIGAYTPQADSFTFYPVFDPQIPEGTKWIEKLYAGAGQLFVGTSKRGARIFDPRTRRYRDLGLRDGNKADIFVRDFIHYGGDDYWMATESGIFLYNIQSGRWVHLKNDFSNPYSLSDNAVYTLCRDREGGLWAGTFFGGVNYYTRQYTLFKKYFPQSGSNSIGGHAVREICQDRSGALWIGTEDAGLSRLDSTGRFTHFAPGRGKRSISHSNIHGLLLNGDQLWIGTFHHGLDVLDTRTGRVVRHYSAAKDSLRSDFIYCLYKTRNGTIVAGTNRGLCTYDSTRDRFTAFRNLPGTFYTTLFEDRHGTLWAGTYSQGVHFFNPYTGVKGHYQNEANNARSLPGNRINQVFEDSQGVLWIATEGGLSRLHRESGTFTTVTTRNGLPSNIIYQVLPDDRQQFWISTSRGLVCFTPATGHIKTYSKASGLLSDQFNYNSSYRDSSGRMYFGSGKGLIRFHPGEFRESMFRPTIYLTGFQVYGRELAINKDGSPLTRSISYTSHMTLQHHQSSFSIDFAALSFTAPAMTEYAYKMEGLDRQWTLLKTNRRAYFTGLAPGTYTFMVKASVSSGVWDSPPAVLTIEILPPLWKSTWAYLLYAVLLVAAVYYLFRRYHRRHQEKNRRRLEILALEKEKELYQAKMDFFTNIAHEIRTPLTLIKGPMEVVMTRSADVPIIRENLKIMQRNTDQLLELASQLLDFRKIELQGSRLVFVPTDVADILREHFGRFQPAAAQRRIAFTLEAPPSLLASADLATLDKIVSNLLNNAIKYAATRAFVHLQAYGGAEGHYRVVVKNDGFLIPWEQKDQIFETFYRLKETEKIPGTGIGLALSRSLAELHKGSLELMPPQGDLNVFCLILPLRPEEVKHSVNTKETLV